ncbi:cation:proton antiporter [Rhodobacteraceae bacterium NNCM2]|nr:cation:proton antiporter [Coraliihabitans acroporae]
MAYDQIAILALFTLIYSTAAGGIERTPISGAVVFMGFGLLIGPFGIGAFTSTVESESLKLIAEMTLALVLFVEASKANWKVLSRSFKIPERLILISLPLAVIAGFGVGFGLFGQLTLYEIAILAAVLAPTDAALGKAVVTNPDVPADIREGLNFESGLNDGVCVPIFLTFLTLAVGTSEHERFGSLMFELLVDEIGIGTLTGITVTLIAMGLLQVCVRENWISDAWAQVPVVALAVVCFTGAQALGGSGFIAAFVGGLLFGAGEREKNDALVHAAEGAGDTLALITWVIFGALVVGPALEQLTWPILIYSICSLTVIRMVPVFAALGGMGLTTGERLFIGWFGPRGLASVVFAVMIASSGIPGASTIVATVVWTILLSIIAHGLSALPLIAALKSARRGN